MKRTLIALASIVLLASCSEYKPYEVKSWIYGNETVISDEVLVKGDTVRIGYDMAGREIASKADYPSRNYIGHIAIVK